MFCVYIQCNRNGTRAAERYFNLYPERRHPDIKIFRRLDTNLQQFGCFAKPNRENGRNGQQREELVLGSVNVEPETSTREIEMQMDVPKTSVSRILRKHKFHPYRLHVSQALTPADYPRRREFCNWYLQKIREDENFHNKILWTDESYFASNGYFNRNNVHYWAQENPHIHVPRRNQGRFGCNVWCGLIGNRLIGPIVFQGQLNGQRYLDFLTTEIEDLLDNLPLAVQRDMWFQQDGAPAHNARVVTQYLDNRFENRILATHSETAWPPRSPDMTPLDFFLWGFLKNRVYQNRNPCNNIEELQQRIMDACNVNRCTLGRVVRSVSRRCIMCLEADGQNFEHLL